MDIWIHRDSPVPLYHQIAEALEAELQRSHLEDGCKLMTDKELGRKLHVGRVTVRHAMQILVDKHVIRRRRGAGTFAVVMEEREGLEPEMAEDVVSI